MSTQRYSVTPHPIETLLTWVKSGEIAIPEIQRPFVWESIKVRNLLDSLYQGYPVGYLIAWRNPTVRLKDGTPSAGKRILIDGHLPPPEEQAAIVRFLDYANGRLERTILANRKVIALLHEQKQAIIHRAVTRGLDPTVPLKPSGIPWLGDIPKHWQALQVRRVVSFVTSGSRGWAKYYSDDGLIFLQSGNLGRSMSLNLSFIQHVQPPDGAEGARTRVQRDNVLVCITGAMTGNVAIVDQELPGPAFVNQHVALVRPNGSMIQPRFLAYVLHSDVGRTQFKTNEYGGTKQGLGLSDVKSVFIPVPSSGEQKGICSHLDSEFERFKGAIDRLDHEISLLREYRTRLVADVVTGKLDVRAAASQLPAEAVETLSAPEADAANEDGDLETEAPTAEE